MIRKMRLRVILASILAFFSVIVIIAVLLNVIDYGIVTNRADETLSIIMSIDYPMPGEMDEDEKSGKNEMLPVFPFMGMPTVESRYFTRFFMVSFDQNENAIFTSTDFIAAIDEETAVVYAKQILDKHAKKGYFKEYRYLKEEKDGNTQIVFLNVEREQQSMKTIELISIAVSIVSLLIVSVLSFFFSKKAIAPFAQNIKLQKRFITDASHELKTPLTSILTSVDVIAMTNGEDEWTENIRSQADRMSKLVSNLVVLSKLDEENPLPNKENFSFSIAAWEVIEIYQSQIKAHDKDLVVDIIDDVHMVGEKASIQQMISVLLDNAIRYSCEKAEIRIVVTKKKNKVILEISNTCDFETPPDVDRLFDRFYRPDSSRNTNSGGTGIGLAIAKTVAETHGGTILASCPDGKKMTIKVIL